MSEVGHPPPAQVVSGETLPADSIGLSGTTSSTLANTAPALSVYLAVAAAGGLYALRANGPKAEALSHGLE
jgi:hypothetical protein